MSSLLRTEWLKLKKYPAFWWMTAIVALSYPGMNWLIYTQVYKNQIKNKTMGPILKMLPNPFTFPDVWHSVAFISSWFIFIASIVVIMFITNEYTFKTHRQNIIDGWSRKQFLSAKILDVMMVSILITIIYAIVALIIGSVNKGDSEVNVWENTKYIWLFFMQTFSQLSIAFLVAFIVRKAFVALGIFLFYFIMVEPLIVGIARDRWNDIGRFMPLEISDRLVPLPRFFVRQETEWKALMSQINTHVIYTILLTAAVWGLCYWMNSRRDL